MLIGRCPMCKREVDQNDEPILYQSYAFHPSCFYRWAHNEIPRLEGKARDKGQKLTETESLELNDLREISRR